MKKLHYFYTHSITHYRVIGYHDGDIFCHENAYHCDYELNVGEKRELNGAAMNGKFVENRKYMTLKGFVKMANLFNIYLDNLKDL